MPKTTKDLLEFWEDQMKLSHTSSNYFFRKSPSHYHMMLLVMHAYKYKENLTVEELKTKYPDFRFVGICIQPYTDMVSQAQNILNLDLTNQYSFENFEKSSKSWVLTFLNKTIIIDEKSKIIDGFSNLFTNDIEKTLDLN